MLANFNCAKRCFVLCRSSERYICCFVDTTTSRWDKFPQVSVKESPFHSGDTSEIACMLLKEKVLRSDPGLTRMVGAEKGGYSLKQRHNSR